MRKKEMIAMLLAGGRGSRLRELTRATTKPVVSFGGKYRIIDFCLSNCLHSDIDTVGVVTQYRPLFLHTHIGTGVPWNLDNEEGGVSLLPPFMKNHGGRWYEGTADAVYQNIEYIDMYDPEYVLILSADHIYKMDYSEMLEEHKKNNAAATIAVYRVPWEDASRFGIMSADETGRITKFAEKPKNPESNLASMGIYIFNWKLLREALYQDKADPNSDRDFGMNIIPKMLEDGEKMCVFEFKGYWRDVGTVDSYFDANMALLKENPKPDIFDSYFRVYTKNSDMPPHFVGPMAQISNCLLPDGCTIMGSLTNCVVSAGVVVEEGAVLKDAVVLPGAHIMSGAKLHDCVVMENAVIPENYDIDAVDVKVDGRIKITDGKSVY